MARCLRLDRRLLLTIIEKYDGGPVGLNTLAAIYVSKQNLTEAEPLYRLSLTILDKKGVLSGKRPLFLESSEDNLDLLTQTALDYADLLKKMRRKSDASKIEARIRAVTGKTPAPKKKVS